MFYLYKTCTKKILHIQSQCALWLISLINSLKGRDKRQMLEIWQGHTGWREEAQSAEYHRRLDATKLHLCLDRTEPVCALKERQGKEQSQETSKIQCSLWAEEKQVVHTPQRVLGKAYETQHNVARILWRDGTTNTCHCSMNHAPGSEAALTVSIPEPRDVRHPARQGET